MPVAGSLAIAGATVGSSLISANASQNAADAQANAADKAAQVQWDMYNQTRSDLAPFTQTGVGAAHTLASLFGLNRNGLNPTTMKRAQLALANYPGYQFALNQGVQALDRSAASRGLLLSGGQMKDLTTFGQGLASQTFGNMFSQLYQLAGLGESAGAQTGAFGQQAGANIGNSYMAAGQAQAAGDIGTANAINSGIQNTLFAYQSGKFNPLINSGGNIFGSAQGAANLGSLVMSDIRTKHDVRRIGETDDGLGVYSFKYNGSDKTNVGFIAQEVAQKKPHAVRKTNRGLMLVDYAMAA